MVRYPFSPLKREEPHEAGIGDKMMARRTFCLRILLTVVLLASGAASTACSGPGPSVDGVSDEAPQTPEGWEGAWRGAVTYTKDTVYGSAGGVEPMLDMTLIGDGTCTVKPLEAHPDLLSECGTWVSSGDTVVLHLGSSEVELQIIDGNRLEGKASDFGVHGYETMEFDYLG